MPDDLRGRPRFPALPVAILLSIIIVTLAVLNLKVLPDIARQKSAEKPTQTQSARKVKFEFTSEIPGTRVDDRDVGNWIEEIFSSTGYPKDRPFVVWAGGSYQAYYPKTVRYVYHDISSISDGDKKTLYERSESMGQVTGGIKTSAKGEVVTYDIYFQPEAQEIDPDLSQAFSYWALRALFGFNPAAPDRQLFDEIWQAVKSKGAYPIKAIKTKAGFWERVYQKIISLAVPRVYAAPGDCTGIVECGTYVDSCACSISNAFCGPLNPCQAGAGTCDCGWHCTVGSPATDIPCSNYDNDYDKCTSPPNTDCGGQCAFSDSCNFEPWPPGVPTPTPKPGGGGGDPNSYDRLFPTFRVLVDVDKNGSGDKVMYTSNNPACNISDEINGPVFGYNFQIPPTSCNPNYVTLYNVKYHSGCPGGKSGNYIDQPSLGCKGETPTRDYYIDVMPDYKVISYGGSGNCVKAWWSNPDPGPWFMRCDGTGEWCHGGVDKCPEDIIVVQKITPDNPACTVSGPTTIMNGASASYSISPSNAVTWGIYRKEIHPQPEFGS